MHLDYWMTGLSGQLEGLRKVSFGYQFRCPYCGDSRRKLAKARGYLLDKWGKCFFKCHNCGLTKSLGDFLEDLNPELHHEYVMKMCSQGCPEGAPELMEHKAEVKPSASQHLPRGGVEEHQAWRRAAKWTPAHLYRGEKKRF